MEYDDDRETGVSIFVACDPHLHRYVVQAVAQNVLLNNQTYLPQYINTSLVSAIPINDSTIVVSPFLTTGKSEYISLKPVSGKDRTNHSFN